MPRGRSNQFVQNLALSRWKRLAAACIRVWWDNLYFDKEKISDLCEKAYRRALRASSLRLLGDERKKRVRWAIPTDGPYRSDRALSPIGKRGRRSPN